MGGSSAEILRCGVGRGGGVVSLGVASVMSSVTRSVMTSSDLLASTAVQIRMFVQFRPVGSIIVVGSVSSVVDSSATVLLSVRFFLGGFSDWDRARLFGQMGAFSNETVLSRSVFDGDWFTVGANVGVETAAGTVRIDGFSLLEAVVGGVLEVDGTVVVELSLVRDELRVDGFLLGGATGVATVGPAVGGAYGPAMAMVGPRGRRRVRFVLTSLRVVGVGGSIGGGGGRDVLCGRTLRFARFLSVGQTGGGGDQLWIKIVCFVIVELDFVPDLCVFLTR